MTDAEKWVTFKEWVSNLKNSWKVCAKNFGAEERDVGRADLFNLIVLKIKEMEEQND